MGHPGCVSVLVDGMSVARWMSACGSNMCVSCARCMRPLDSTPPTTYLLYEQEPVPPLNDPDQVSQILPIRTQRLEKLRLPTVSMQWSIL